MSYVNTSNGEANAAQTPLATGTAGAVRACDVHALLDGDQRPRKVRYCSLCDAWLCDDCRRNPVRRARAAMKARGW